VGDKNTHIRAYSFALGTDPLQDQLETIASAPENVFRGNNVTALTRDLAKVTEDIGRESEQMTLTAVLNRPYTGTRLRFKINGDWIEGTVMNEPKEDFIDITCSSPNLYEPESVKITKEGTGPNSPFSYDFTVNKYYPANSRTGTMEKVTKNQFTKASQFTPDNEAEVTVHEQIDRKSVVVYFLLDNSKSMGTRNLDSIKKAVINSVRNFYDREKVSTLTPAAPVRSVAALPAPAYLDPITTLDLWKVFVPIKNPLLAWDFIRQRTSLPNTGSPGYLQASFGQSGSSDDLQYEWIQLLSVNGNKKAVADKLVADLKSYRLNAYIWDREQDPGQYVVRLGPFRTAAEASTIAAEMVKQRPQ
jgi:phage terminase large subunit-like protein